MGIVNTKKDRLSITRKITKDRKYILVVKCILNIIIITILKVIFTALEHQTISHYAIFSSFSTRYQ